MKKQVAIIVSALMLLSCMGEDKKTEVFNTYEIHGTTWKSKSAIQFIGSYNFQATEVPLMYHLYKSLEDNQKNKMDSIFVSHKNERIIEMEFSHISEKDLLEPGLNTQPNYTAAVEYLAFAIGNDFEVVTSSNDTIACAGVHFERHFNVAPYKKLLLYFTGIPQEEDIQLVYRDRLFGNGTIKFNLKEEPIQL